MRLNALKRRAQGVKESPENGEASVCVKFYPDVFQACSLSLLPIGWADHSQTRIRRSHGQGKPWLYVWSLVLLHDDIWRLLSSPLLLLNMSLTDNLRYTPRVLTSVCTLATILLPYCTLYFVIWLLEIYAHNVRFYFTFPYPTLPRTRQRMLVGKMNKPGTWNPSNLVKTFKSHGLNCDVIGK